MQDRRRLLAAGLALPAVVTVPALPAAKPAEVTASEDLMREHGVLRRILIVYDELVPKLRGQGGAVDAAALRSLADLFRRFGEDYHEKILEEQNVFPRVRELGGQTATLVDTLEQQHRRGREITEVEYLDLVGPPDIDLLQAKHPGLRWMMEWRSKPGRETDYGQVERIFHLISEFKRGNRALRYRLTISDMG